ncbi:MAG: hypothetical protein C0501_15285 [Isosphaera sp.]|nr:hypothetical protein [Isosphaera sp.]
MTPSYAGLRKLEGWLYVVVGGILAAWPVGWCALGSLGYIASFDIALTYSLGFVGGACLLGLVLVVAGGLLIRSGRKRQSSGRGTEQVMISGSGGNP